MGLLCCVTNLWSEIRATIRWFISKSMDTVLGKQEASMFALLLLFKRLVKIGDGSNSFLKTKLKVKYTWKRAADIHVRNWNLWRSYSKWLKLSVLIRPIKHEFTVMKYKAKFWVKHGPILSTPTEAWRILAPSCAVFSVSRHSWRMGKFLHWWVTECPGLWVHCTFSPTPYTCLCFNAPA